MNPVNIYPSTHEMESNKNDFHSRRIKSGLMEDSRSNLEYANAGSSAVNFHAMLQNSITPSNSQPEVASSTKYENEPVRDSNEKILSSPDKSQNQNNNTDTSVANDLKDNIEKYTDNDLGKKPEKNLKNKNMNPGEYLDKSAEIKTLKKNNSNDLIVNNEISVQIREKELKIKQTIQNHYLENKKINADIENSNTLNPKDIKELMASGIKKADSKAIIQAEIAVNNIVKNIEPQFEKNKVQNNEKLHLKNKFQQDQVKDEKNNIENEKTDKTGKTISELLIKSKLPVQKAVHQNPDNIKVIDLPVSRETIHVSLPEKKQNSNTSDDIQLRGFSNDRALSQEILKSNLKSSLDSEFSPGQHQQGHFLHSTDRLNFLNKMEENPVLKQNLQQQFDQLLQRAKVIIRENGNAQLSTKLYPKELGEISIKLSLINGKLTGKITVDNDFVQKELNNKLSGIFADLKTEGYSIESFQVDVKSGTGEDSRFKEAALNSENPAFGGFSVNSKTEKQLSGFQSSDFDNYINSGREIYA